MKTDTDHDRNDRIEATVLLAALATLCLLVAIAVSTSVGVVSSDQELHATTPDPALTGAGLETAGAAPAGPASR